MPVLDLIEEGWRRAKQNADKIPRSATNMLLATASPSKISCGGGLKKSLEKKENQDPMGMGWWVWAKPDILK